LGRAAILLFPGLAVPLPGYGVSTWWRSDDHVSLSSFSLDAFAADLPPRLIKYDTFSEDVTKFYMAECILAIEAVHNLGFIHR